MGSRDSPGTKWAQEQLQQTCAKFLLQFLHEKAYLHCSTVLYFSLANYPAFDTLRSWSKLFRCQSVNRNFSMAFTDYWSGPWFLSKEILIFHHHQLFPKFIPIFFPSTSQIIKIILFIGFSAFCNTKILKENTDNPFKFFHLEGSKNSLLTIIFSYFNQIWNISSAW